MVGREKRRTIKKRRAGKSCTSQSRIKPVLLNGKKILKMDRGRLRSLRSVRKEGSVMRRFVDPEKIGKVGSD